MIEYLVVQQTADETLEAFLNRHASFGWRLHTIMGATVIFVREPGKRRT